MDQGSGVTTLRDYFMVIVTSNSKMADYLSLERWIYESLDIPSVIL